MIRRSNERTVKTVEHRFGAPGFITVQNLINGPEELNGKGSFFAHVHLLPGHGIGYHVHEKDSEIYYILRGKGEISGADALYREIMAQLERARALID